MNEQRKWTIVLATMTVFVAAVAFLPGLVRAGNLKPSAPPGSTMKTLDEIPPTWSQKLPVCERFELVLLTEEDVGGSLPALVYKAVLDKETGLVWEKSPRSTEKDWYEACLHCYQSEVGGRMGWRLPTVEELTSLVDTTNTSPALPTGHPFSNVQWGGDEVDPSAYWSSTTSVYGTNTAWQVEFRLGAVGWRPKNDGDDKYVWCVRGGHGHDAY